MNRYLPLLPLAVAALLSACASEPTATAPAAAPAPAPASAPTVPAAEVAPGPSLRGELLGVAAGADVDLALLAIDLRGRPSALLAQVQLRGDGAPLPFRLPLAANKQIQGQRIELRGRVSLSGRLVQRLPPRTIAELKDQDLGSLQLVPAP
ncbi:YbaY family lipoprotein [Ectopseudomonas hydrolytica]|uniref:YbaY family lipoprotein n=1 Tax=Ectopseudomonas hydrolytica TaxID=2493633 RepID=UPI003C30992D